MTIGYVVLYVIKVVMTLILRRLLRSNCRWSTENTTNIIPRSKVFLCRLFCLDKKPVTVKGRGVKDCPKDCRVYLMYKTSCWLHLFTGKIKRPLNLRRKQPLEHFLMSWLPSTTNSRALKCDKNRVPSTINIVTCYPISRYYLECDKKWSVTWIIHGTYICRETKTVSTVKRYHPKSEEISSRL